MVVTTIFELSLAVADPAFRQVGGGQKEYLNGLSIVCEAATARIKRAGGRVWEGVSPTHKKIFDVSVFEKAIFLWFFKV